MNIRQIISRKKQGDDLTTAEIQYFVRAVTDGEIPDYQTAALLMAIYFRGCSAREISDLTLAMAKSGDMVDLSSIPGIKTDKHSTGGVGDKVSLIAVPVLAAMGARVVKMSGRGLGHTGGTIDKLESIPGFNTEIGTSDFLRIAAEKGMVIAGQTGNLAPADKKLYALRDAIECVDSTALIASSIMSKKIASGADALVLDVKVGSGAFMKDLKSARDLAQTMTEIGRSLNIRTAAVITAMDSPLGRQVGNLNEVIEAAEILKGGGSGALVTVTTEIIAYMALLSDLYPDIGAARNATKKILKNGEGFLKFKELIQNQGADPNFIDSAWDAFADIPTKIIRAERSGFISGIDAEKTGNAAMLLGAGRKDKESGIDHLAGIEILKEYSGKVQAGEPLFKMYSRAGFAQAEQILKEAVTISGERPTAQKYIYEVIE